MNVPLIGQRRALRILLVATLMSLLGRPALSQAAAWSGQPAIANGSSRAVAKGNASVPAQRPEAPAVEAASAVPPALAPSLAAAAPGAAAAPPALPQPAIPGPVKLSLSSSSASETLHIVVGQSLILRGANPMKRIYIGNPAILQSYTSAPEEVVLTAKIPGVSSLVVWDSEDHCSLYTVSADLDTSGLRRSLEDAYPNSPVQVESLQDHIRLSGVVPSPEVADGAVKLASAYGKEIANSLRVIPAHGKQVQLKLRILEVDRTKLDQFGINLTYSGKPNVSTTTQQFSNPLNFSFYNAKTGLGVQLQDLASRQIVQILAEPTLTTISGLPAHFLSGGEFPFPVAQQSGNNSTAITIQFRTYGVKVDFLPTVNADGTIRLKVSPEVSTLDYTNAVTVAGFTVPALSTRRAETEVELQDGQTFALTGLLDRRTTDLLAQAPGIASVPILGQLFKSKNNTHSVAELVVLVNVSVVDPLTAPPPPPAEPHWGVPNIDVPHFDHGLGMETHADPH
jgi:pilus assembly protein CpaC